MSGQEAYRQYLQSDKWKTIRAQRLAMDNEECVLCGEKAKHVHHRRYPKEWGTETVNDLVCLCDTCHEKYHDESVRITLPEDMNKDDVSRVVEVIGLFRNAACVGDREADLFLLGCLFLKDLIWLSEMGDIDSLERHENRHHSTGTDAGDTE